MHPPAGFAFLPETERAARATRVFDVERQGVRYVCKRLAQRALDEAWMRERLAAEGRLLAQMDGHGAPRLVASGEDAQGPWVVMERVTAPALATAPGRTDPRWLARATRAAFEALAAIHARGVVHADLSPTNVLVDEDGARATLIDFGLAVWSGAPPMLPGPFRGTLLYAAPEVARGEVFGARADLFALAASLLHAWSGEAPRPQASEAAMLLAAGEEGIEAWAARVARGLDVHVARALVECCAFDAARRPERAEGLL
ncbi:MAG TPA: protein kinase [Polyangiaceae bacterium]|jgi:serine/threonine protein kinase